MTPNAPDARPAPSSKDASRSPSAATVRRWRRYLADERAEAAVYRDLASRRTGEERAILMALAEAEGRHEAHWLALLGDRAGSRTSVDVRTRILGFLARRFGSVFVLALAQRAEARSPYDDDSDATPQMAADERIHEEVVRALAARGRSRLSGSFRAAVFGANDGLVSNLSLVLGVSATGLASPTAVLATGVAGLFAGALSMGAGEYVSVRSQRELLAASTPNPDARTAIPHLDVDANELTLVYRARGMSEQDAADHASEVLARVNGRTPPAGVTLPVQEALAAPGDAADFASVEAAVEGGTPEHEELGTGLGAALSSFLFFASGAVVPIIPFFCGLSGYVATIVAAVLVGVALLGTGAIVGVLSGASPLRRALRQLGMGYGAAAVTYVLGTIFGTSVH